MCRILSTAICFVALFQGCETDQDQYINQNKDALLVVSTNISHVEADGKSDLFITALLPTEADKKSIQFQTTDGSFRDSNSKKILLSAMFRNDSLSARANLVSSLEAKPNVEIRISIEGVEKLLNVSFLQAYPDSLNIESSVATIKPGFGSEVPVQAFLIRKQGIPSLHQLVSFNAIDDKNARLGEFRAISSSGSDSNGVINATYVLKDTTYQGLLRIIAEANSKTDILRDTLKIFISK